MKLASTPKFVDIDLTNACNLRCSYCHHFTGPGDVGEDLPSEEWLKFFEELKQCAVLKVSLSGGEPLFRSDFKTLVDGIIKSNLRFAIFSNGTLVDEDIAQYLRSTGRCDSFQISIDGAGPKEHDVCRGKGNFERAVNGLRCLIKHKIPTTVRVTIHKHNVESLEQIAEFLLEDIGLPSFSTNSASHMGLCQVNKEKIQLTPTDLQKAMMTLSKLDKKYRGRILAAGGPLANVKAWGKMEKAKQQKESLENCGYLRSCGGVLSRIAVLANGAIVPCNKLSHIKLGKINQDSLRNVWINHPELKRLRERRNFPLTDLEKCRNCNYVNYCKGGCPALAYILSGDDSNVSVDACYKSFIESGGSLPKEAMEQDV